MRVLRFFRSCAVVLACISWILPLRDLAAAPPTSLAESAPPARSAATIDVALSAGGRLVGQVVDGAGTPLARQVIAVQSVSGGPVVRTTSDQAGRFVVEGLTGGVFQVAASQSVTTCRCWTNGAAPPAATNQLLLVNDGSVQRGQRPIGELLFSNPVLIGLIIAAAIAIPIAVHNSKDDDSAS